jgi:hypothetical protein
MKKLTASFLGFVILPLLIVTASGCGSAQEAQPSAAPGGDTTGNSDYIEPVEVVTPEYAEGEELLCLCDNEEEARKIADLYGIELVQFQYGVATFHAEDPMSVIALGKEKGYPELELNGISSIFDN